MSIKNSIVNRIKKLRFGKRISIRRIAVKLHLSPTTVIKYVHSMKNEEKIVPKITSSDMCEGNECLDEPEMLDRIISEVTESQKRLDIVRLVTPFLSDPWKGFEALADVLILAGGISPHEKEFVLRNWAGYVGIDDAVVEEFFRLFGYEF